MSNYVDTVALRDALSQASCIKLKMREDSHGVTVYTDDGHEMTFAWCGPSSFYSAHGSRARREMGTRADAALIVALVNAAPALLDELDMRRQQVLDLGEDLNGVELRAETAEAECERLREATRAVCESTDASAVQLGLRMLRAALAPQEPSTTSTPPTPGGAHTQD